MAARTLFEKIWDRHVVAAEEGELLLYVDRVLIHEGSTHAFAQLAAQPGVARPRPGVRHGHHYVPTTAGRAGGRHCSGSEHGGAASRQRGAARITLFGIDDPRQGILHIGAARAGHHQARTHHRRCRLAPPLTARLPLPFGAGASEVCTCWPRQLWQRKPATLRSRRPGRGRFRRPRRRDSRHHRTASAPEGAAHGIERGLHHPALTMEGRVTLCNMSMSRASGDGGAGRNDLLILEGRPYAPRQLGRGAGWWKTLPSDAGRCSTRKSASMARRWRWSDGGNPEHALPITRRRIRAARRRQPAQRVCCCFDYMGLAAGTPLRDITIDRCSSARAPMRGSRICARR